MMAAEWGTLSFDEQVRFFAGKHLVPTEHWNEVWKEAHDGSFMVAGAMKAELLQDLHGAIAKAIGQGTTLEEFRRDFDGIVAQHGWTGWRGETTEAGRAWRARLIYETNLNSSYQAGRWAQVQAAKARRPYLIYRHSDLSAVPRPLHVKWDGTVLPVDDPWVKTHWPPNGWGCKCRMFSLSERDLKRMGKSGPDPAPEHGAYEWIDKLTGETHTVPAGIDAGWDYAPGALALDLKQQVERKIPVLPGIIGTLLQAELNKPQDIPKPPVSPDNKPPDNPDEGIQ